jgi:PAS domain S-box-containing protein
MRHLPLPSFRHSLITAAAFTAVTAVMLGAQDHLVLIDVVLAYYALAIVIAFVLGRRAAAVVVVFAPVASVLLLQLTGVDPQFGTGAAFARAAAVLVFGVGALYAMPRWLAGADEFRRLSQMLRERTQTLETLANSAPVAIITVDRDCVITSWNPAAERIYGQREAQTVGRPISDSTTRQMLSLLMDAGASFRQIEARRARTDGRIVDVSVSAAPLRDDGGDVSGAVIVLADVTERKAADEALRRADEFRASVMESTTDAIFAVDLKRRFTLVNRRVCEITGYTQEELLGETPALFITPETNERGLVRFQRVIESAQPEPVHESHIIRKGGAPGTIRVSLTPLMDGGKVAGIVGTAEDVTERKRLEEQFLQSQKLESIGRLAGGVAHDFNNLMTAIIGYAELSLVALDPGDPVAADVKDIRATADRAANLAHQLLAFSRRQMIEPRVVDMNELISGAHTMLRRLIGENIELVTQAAPDLKPVKVDPTQFTQVVVNLVVNARDAMPAGGTLTLATANVELDGLLAAEMPGAAGPYVRLTATDTGAGMTEDVLQHLFEPFFTTKDTGRGTGLGLATCYGVVKQAGGNIFGCNEPGGGSTFAVYLPASAQPVEAAAEGDAPALPGGQETILLAEDERAVHKLASRVLRELGYTVLSAVDGGEALRILEQHGGAIDLLITDVVMPGMNGKELAERVTRQRPSVRVLLTSGYADDELVRHDIASQSVAFLPKPFSPQMLARQVREVLDGAH